MIDDNSLIIRFYKIFIFSNNEYCFKLKIITNKVDEMRSRL